MDKRFEQLKSELFNWGLDYIEEFLGFEADGYSHSELDSLMDQICAEMSDDQLAEFYAKFNIE